VYNYNRYIRFKRLKPDIITLLSSSLVIKKRPPVDFLQGHGFLIPPLWARKVWGLFGFRLQKVIYNLLQLSQFFIEKISSFGDFITYTTIIKKQLLSDLQKRREKKEEGEEELPHDDGSRATRLRM
jgi:hypothetical protein